MDKAFGQAGYDAEKFNYVHAQVTLLDHILKGQLDTYAAIQVYGLAPPSGPEMQPYMPQTREREK